MGPVAPEDWNAAMAAAPPLLDEARASVALDGDTQSEPTEPVAVDAFTAALLDIPSDDKRFDIQQRNVSAEQIIEGIGKPVIHGEDGRYHCPVCNVSYDHPQGMGPHFRLHWQEAGVKLSDIPNGNDTVRCPECSLRVTRRGLGTGHLAHKHGVDPAVATGIARIIGFSLDEYLHPKPAPTPPNYETRQQQLVDCPYARCGATHKRKYMVRHLEAIHGIKRDEAVKRSRNLAVSAKTESAPSKLPGSKGRPKKAPTPSQAPAVIEHANAVVPPEPEQAANGGAPGIEWTTIAPTDIAIGVVQSQINGHLPSGLIPDVVEYVDRTREVIAKLRATRS